MALCKEHEQQREWQEGLEMAQHADGNRGQWIWAFGYHQVIPLFVFVDSYFKIAPSHSKKLSKEGKVFWFSLVVPSRPGQGYLACYLLCRLGSL